MKNLQSYGVFTLAENEPDTNGLHGFCMNTARQWPMPLSFVPNSIGVGLGSVSVKSPLDLVYRNSYIYSEGKRTRKIS